MYGMTSYATYSYEKLGYSYTIEVRTQNHRFRDLNISMPTYLNPLEMSIRKLVYTAIARGSIDLIIQVINANPQGTIHINDTLIQQLRDVQTMVSGRATDLRIADIMAFDRTIIAKSHPNIDEHEEPLLNAIRLSLAKCNDVRKEEGAIIASEMQKHLSIITSGTLTLREKAPKVEQVIHDTVDNHFKQWQVEEPQRMYQEIAALAIKASIAEELTLLEGHIQAMQESIDKNTAEQVGKRLDFLAQEMNREMHTIASKAMLPEIHTVIVDLREAVENIRELVRNVE